MSETDALEKLRAACEDLRIGVEDALLEKAEEVACRAFLKCIPNHTLRSEQIARYIRDVGQQPTDELVERVEVTRRGAPLSHDEIIELEDRQNLRCALCGTRLDRAARPHVDHKTPVALGGKSDLDNLQLLCHQCNMGKGALLAWVLGVPFQTRRLTYRLRYCVLARAGGHCEQPGCRHTSMTSALTPTTRIPEQMGGPTIIDNLYVLCEEHHAAKLEGNRQRVRNTLKLKRIGGLFGLSMVSSSRGEQHG